MPASRDELEQFRVFIEGWTEKLLRPYLDALGTRADKSCTNGKEFNDAIWTTVFLHPLEVLLLDSPLLQRLRHIRQLGVVHLVYPSATHTRLDHSLGTVHQASELIAGINGSVGGAKDAALISKELETLVRVTALCHDIGHGVTSHVSENALQHFPQTRKMVHAFQQEVRLEKLKPSEIAAYYMVLSAPFRELLAEAARISGDHSLPAEATKRIAEAIIGKKIDDDVPLLHELISGPFDADKLDYMTRDARLTGVPVVTDIPRLVQKVRGRQMATGDLPEELRELVPKKKTTCTMTGIALSGGRTLDELVFGQTLLFDKIYRHQKVRAAEAMVAGVFDQIGSLCPAGILAAPYEMRDGQLFELDLVGIRSMAGCTLTRREKTRAEVAIDLSRRLRDRRLFRRAYAFAQNMPLDPYRSDEEHRLGLVGLIGAARHPDSRTKLLPDLIAATEEILSILGREQVEAEIAGKDISPYIWIDPPKAKTQSNETPRAYLISDGSEGAPIMPFRDEYAETPGWSNAYLLTRDTGYVFTIDELSMPVYLAMEKVARLRYGVRSPESMIPYAKHDPQELKEAKAKLEAAGFYADSPFDIRPEPERFGNANFAKRLEKIRTALSSYQGPVFEAQEKKRSTIMSPERIKGFAQQFGPEHADEAVKIMERLHVVGREDLIAAVKAFLASTSESYSLAVPLGEAKDSSAVTTYQVADIASLKVRGLRSALSRDGSILFAEDFVGTGNQTISLFENLLGIEQSVDLHEEREEPLSPDARELLRNRQLALVFASGSRKGAEAVETAARERLGLTLEVYLHQEVAPHALGASPGFVEHCREIGRQLLQDEDPEHDEAWVEKRTLGYGNRGFLVTFPYNTPTQALTCLWKAGKVDGVEWVPLLPRRPKR